LSLRKENPPETVTRKLERTHAEVRRASAGGRATTWLAARLDARGKPLKAKG
jgi:hypothetical protein